MTRALIVVDVQNDFCEGGSLAVEGGSAAAQEIRDYIAGVQYDLIVFTRDFHKAPGDHFASNTNNPTPNFTTTWPDHCVAGTPGAGFHEALKDIKPDAIVSKGQYSAAYSGFEGNVDGTEGLTLAAYLSDHNVDDIDVCGIAFDYCVKATAADAARFAPYIIGNVRVLKSLTASVDPSQDHEVTVQLAGDGVSVVEDGADR